MKDCCIRSFVNWGVAEHFRLAEEGEGHTCATCGMVFRLVGGYWTEALPDIATTVNVITSDDPVIDLGWARGTRNPDGTITVQCWGCGAVKLIPNRPYTEFHFDHATEECSMVQAAINRSKNAMPTLP